MKRHALIRELEKAGCEFVRHGGQHDLYRNPANGRQAPVPRHREIPETLCKAIRRQLGLGDNDPSETNGQLQNEENGEGPGVAGPEPA